MLLLLLARRQLLLELAFMDSALAAFSAASANKSISTHTARERLFSSAHTAVIYVESYSI
jgi:hypothetical protein